MSEFRAVGLSGSDNVSFTRFLAIVIAAIVIFIGDETIYVYVCIYTYIYIYIHIYMYVRTSLLWFRVNTLVFRVNSAWCFMSVYSIDYCIVDTLVHQRNDKVQNKGRKG